jgi:hypothetical protein
MNWATPKLVMDLNTTTIVRNAHKITNEAQTKANLNPFFIKESTVANEPRYRPKILRIPMINIDNNGKLENKYETSAPNIRGTNDATNRPPPIIPDKQAPIATKMPPIMRLLPIIQRILLFRFSFNRSKLEYCWLSIGYMCDDEGADEGGASLGYC